MPGLGDGWRYRETYFIGEDADEFDRAFGTRLFDTRNPAENMRVKAPLRRVSILLSSSSVCGAPYCNLGHSMLLPAEGLQQDMNPFKNC